MDTSAFTDDSKDYLLDPELWLDKLPQPFQMIDEVLQEFLDQVWEKIERREILRAQEEARIKIPALPGAQILSQSERGAVISSHSGLVLVGDSSSLTVWCEDEGQWQSVMCHEWAKCPVSLTVGESKAVTMVAAVFKHEVKLFAYVKGFLIHLTDITFSVSEEENISEITHTTISPTWSHLTLATSHSDEGSKLQLYKLPLDSWHTEIERYIEQEEGEQTQSRVSVASKASKQKEEIVFSAASLLYSVQPPAPVTACTAADPASAMHRILEDSTPESCIATGECHILSEAYLTTRRKAFVSQRADFVQENREPLSFTNSSPHCHFLYYKNCIKQATPCQIAVWWTHHNQVLVYPIPDSVPKIRPHPVKLLPQTAAIACSAVSEDGLHMAIGLTNGTVVLWNMRTALCSNIVKAVDSPDSLSVMAFREHQLVVGSESGRVLVVSTEANRPTTTWVGHRVGQQQKAYPHMFQHSGYNVDSKVVDLQFDCLSLSTVVSSVHANGAMVLWSLTECKALCKVSVPQHPPAGRQYACTLTNGRLFVLGESEDSLASVFSIDLHSTPTLTPHWVTPSTPSHAPEPCTTSNGMSSSVESYLLQYVKTRCNQFAKDKEKWQKRWIELPQVLARQSITAQ